MINETHRRSSLRACLLAFCALAGSMAAGVPAAGNSVPAALKETFKEIRQRSYSCPNETPPVSVPLAPEVYADLTCALTAADLRKR